MTPLAAALLTLFAPAPTDDPPAAPPKGPAPLLLVAQVNKDGQLVTRTTREVYRTRAETRTRVVNGKPVNYTTVVTEAVPTVVEKVHALKTVQVSNAAGKKIDAGELPKLLAKPTLVLLSVDGKPVDPFYLRAFKKGHLVLAWVSPGGPRDLPEVNLKIPRPKE